MLREIQEGSTWWPRDWIGPCCVSHPPTDSHPFWDQATHTWIPAGQLTNDARLRTPNGTSISVVSGRAPPARGGDMWDLTIATDHTYYVVAGATAVLVHNCGNRNAFGQFAGENPDAARGRLVHDNYEATLDDGYKFNRRLDNGLRPDAINRDLRIVRELKSDAPGSQATGRRQLANYVAQLEAETGEKWTGYLDTYSR